MVVEGEAGEEVHVRGGGFFPPSDSRSCVGGGVGGAGGQSKCEGNERIIFLNTPLRL